MLRTVLGDPGGARVTEIEKIFIVEMGVGERDVNKQIRDDKQAAQRGLLATAKCSAGCRYVFGRG